MKFPKFWASGSQDGFVCWRWSDSSLAEAEALAREAARKLAGLFAAGKQPQGRYAYGDRPLREPVLNEVRGPAGEMAAVVTRNSYGCLVLNTTGVMLLDKDWDARYRKAGDGRATCKWIATLGAQQVHPAIQPILKIHDETTRAESGLDLA